MLSFAEAVVTEHLARSLFGHRCGNMLVEGIIAHVNGRHRSTTSRLNSLRHSYSLLHSGSSLDIL